MGPPKNKAFLISQLKEKHPELDEAELASITVLELTKMLKTKPVEPKVEDTEEVPSLAQRLGCY